jgi:hypothetical protein
MRCLQLSGEGDGEIRTVVGNCAGVDHRASGRCRAGLPELPPGLLLRRLLGVRVGLVVAVEEDVLLERGVLVHAFELGHGDDGLLPLSGRAGARPLDIVGGRHDLVELRNAVLVCVLLYPETLVTEKACLAT